MPRQELSQLPVFKHNFFLEHKPITLLWRSVLLFVGITLPLTAIDAKLSAIQLKFYDQNLVIPFESEMRLASSVVLEERALQRQVQGMQDLEYQPLLQAIQEISTRLQLNDWFYTQLLRSSLEKIYTGASARHIELWTYILLAKSGFDTRLTYRSDRLQVNVYTEDTLYEIPLIQDAGRQYVNLSYKSSEGRRKQSMYLLNQRLNPRGRPFTFKLAHWPLLLTSDRERVVSFDYRDTRYNLAINYRPGIANLLENYPLIDEHWYLEAPLSPALEQSLVPKLKRLLEGKSQRQALEILVSLTRTGFAYMDDQKAYATNKPMVADELFHYQYSDCEDRSALFYALTKTLLDLPMIVIAYDDHLSIAVEAPTVNGAAVNYNGRRYVFCDPTGPDNSAEIGKIPSGYEDQKFEIIGTYK